MPGRDKPRGFNGSTPWVTTSDLLHLGYTLSSKQGIGLTNEEIDGVRARVIPAGSILITCVGELGVTSICGQDMVVNQQLHSFQAKDGMNNVFFMCVISFQKDYRYRNASQTTVPYMNKTACNKIPMIAPPIDLQNQFAAIVEKVESLKNLYQQNLTELENLYGALSQKPSKESWIYLVYHCTIKHQLSLKIIKMKPLPLLNVLFPRTSTLRLQI